MGATCDTLCSRQASKHQTQPNMQIMRSPPSPILTSDEMTRLPNSKPSDTIVACSEGIQSNSNNTISSEFQQAIKEGNETMVHFYLSDYSSMNLLNKPFNNYDTPLHIAVKNKQYNIIEILLEEGASVNKQNHMTGDTSLHIAVSENDIKSVKLLLEYGANGYINNIDDKTALNIAQQYKYKNILNEFGEEMKFGEEENTNVNTPVFFDINMRQNTKMMHKLTNSVLDSTNTNIPSNEHLLTSYNTERLQDISSSIFNDITLTLKDNKCKLIQLKGWLKKKKSLPPYSWLKRWVVIKDNYMLWSDRQINVENNVTDKEKMRWNKCIHLRKIINVEIIKGKKNQRNFKMSIKKGRDYIWKCETNEMRDKWVDGLNEHIEHCKMESVYS